MYQSKKILNLQKFRELNEYIVEKVESISQLFGTRVTRNETINEDEYQYIRPYKKNNYAFYVRSVRCSVCKCRK